MASRNSTLFLGLIVAISAIMAAAPSNAIVISFDPLSVTDMIVIRGVLSCAINVTLSPNGIVPPFPNAPLKLMCGNRTLANTTTDMMGTFGFSLVPNIVNGIGDLTNLLVSPSSNCTVVVTTPLATCNASLPSTGTLVSGLLPGITQTLFGFLRIINIQLGGFRLL
ncbi:hypothetical protein DCAR_0623731 [Daucus carota subsp. sativus]|uniref:Uncharacterized protein n=1 Tax=Daucus carota subsp. sativus TaxID=79200 RepID=A0A164VE07_DAUCS|nr:PREDICTED: phylloplanin-like [Daucus carota subsp. sativus]WOH04322.1 hypothetical protein DCAR_0623731 [Daucus carota subsp. sativus]